MIPMGLLWVTEFTAPATMMDTGSRELAEHEEVTKEDNERS